MNGNCFCIFPFFHIDRPYDISNLSLSPLTDEKLKSLSPDDLDSLSLIEETLAKCEIKRENISVCIQPRKMRYEELLNNLKRMSNYLRFRLSYQNEQFDYDQASFIIVHPSSQESKVSINGASPTVLDADFLWRRTSPLASINLTIPEKDIPVFSGLKLFLSAGLMMPDESRFWRALDWYGRSFIRDNGIDEHHAVLCLAVAFEALLGLPEQSIGNSFASYVSNFFQGSEFLVRWAKEFYELRSTIIHGSEILQDTIMDSPRKAVSFKYIAKGTHLRLNSIDIARPVFRDLIEGLSILHKKKKQYDYDEVFRSDYIILGQIANTLNGLNNGFQTEDDIMQIGGPFQELREDGSATYQQILDVSQAILNVLIETLLNTRFVEDLSVLFKKFKRKDKINPEDVRRLCEEASDKLKMIKNAEDIPSQAIIHPSLLKGFESTTSNFYEDCIETGLEWFNYAKAQLYLIDDSK